MNIVLFEAIMYIYSLFAPHTAHKLMRNCDFQTKVHNPWIGTFAGRLFMKQQ